MRIPELRHHIFCYLPLKDIKACRLVCHEWNATAVPLLIATSRIRFHNRDEARTPDRFIEEFQTGELLDKCNNFFFDCVHNWIEYDELLRFIEKFGDTMKELTIYGAYVHPFKKLSLDARIKLIPSQLTKLDIVCSDTILTVSMGRLQNIKTLRLVGCILEITGGAVCAPVELHLSNLHFSINDFKINIVMKLNHLFDFHNLKDIHVDSSDSNFKLDLSEGALKLNNLEYINFKAKKQKSSKWTVRKLMVDTETEYTSPTGMVFEELSFDGPALDAEILPTTLRILEMDGTDVKLLHRKAVQNLVNLKYLLFHGTRSSNLAAFRNCANLTHLHLCAGYEVFEELLINVKLIAKTVKVFRLSDEYVLLGKIDSEMETVIMENISIKQYDDTEIDRVINAWWTDDNVSF
ncbi:hypothetical protein Bhyg_09342 [Pseudolycoriella hygida]|uniref:F-box domain-containing protein n=1 Tax=Pseudolycoriella hygida TaxID=35572 RepID=A0A9Q0N6A1_9DIPT|nr:hypothetical protein Bhyg_09342 [Pseudolycoriella hygida]